MRTLHLGGYGIPEAGMIEILKWLATLKELWYEVDTSAWEHIHLQYNPLGILEQRRCQGSGACSLFQAPSLEKLVLPRVVTDYKRTGYEGDLDYLID